MPVDDEILNPNLKIENYNLWMPKQWSKHDQARTIVYTRDHLSVSQVPHDERYDDLPVVLLDIGQQGAKKSRLCGVYREYKGGVSGLDSNDAQLDRMQRMKEYNTNTDTTRGAQFTPTEIVLQTVLHI